MTGCSRGSFCFSRHALGTRHGRLVFGFETHGSGVPGLGFLFGATQRFPRRLFFGCHARQRRSFRNLLGTQLFVRQIGRAPLGVSPLSGQASELFLFVGPCDGSGCKFGRGEFPTLGIRQRTLFRLDSRAQGDFGHAFDMRLLRSGSLGGGLGGGATDGVFRGKAIGLQPSLRGGGLLGGLRQPQLGGGTGPLFSAGARQCIGLGGALDVRRVCRDDRITRDALLALPLHIHQSRQYLAQVYAPHSGSGFKRPVVAA